MPNDSCIYGEYVLFSYAYVHIDTWPHQWILCSGYGFGFCVFILSLELKRLDGAPICMKIETVENDLNHSLYIPSLVVEIAIAAECGACSFGNRYADSQRCIWACNVTHLGRKADWPSPVWTGPKYDTTLSMQAGISNE